MSASILVVDDVEANIKLLEAKLLSEYYIVFSANSGAKALEILAKNKIDLVLLDVMMPNMDGFETCRRIKANPEFTHIPVIIITALSDVEDKIKGLEAGADEFLTKPINDVPLLPRVRSLARMKMLIDELKLRNRTNQELGASIIEVKDDFSESKILLINDDVVQIKNLNNILTNITNNIKIITNTNNINSLGTYAPDLIIISCQLEEVDPLRIAMTLMSKENYKYSICMLMAEEENLPIVIKGMELGINDYFLCSADKNELIARIRTQLRKKAYQDNLRNSLELTINLSIKDGLTNVFNRRYFDMHIQQMMLNAETKATPLCIIMLDVDHFKEVNDTYGHQEGDTILKIFATAVKDSLRVTDLIARYGGEEFVVLLGDTDLRETEKIANRIKQTISETQFEIKSPTGDLILNKTASLGITEYMYGETAQSFVERADGAMYQAKNSGRNKVVSLKGGAL